MINISSDCELKIIPIINFDKTLDFFIKIMNDREVQNNMGDWSVGPKSKEEVEQYLRARQIDTWIIEKDNEYIGYIGIFIKRRHGVGITRIAILNKYRGKVCLSEVYKSVIEFTFTALQLRTLHASMISSNLSSFKFHKKVGFKEIGRYAKSRVGIDGKIYDEILMELTKEMYYENKNTLQ